ncbi:MAG: hypothetical protein ILP16_11955 [Spirochaetales bacterium]|nr:hypothetical protein [Spirochaetales bacterium]
MDARETFLSYLNTLDENYYFFIANNILGRISTPFHKPVLNQQILSFLLNDRNRKAILSSLDADERRYLSLLMIAGETSSKQIQQFFSEDSYPMVVTRMYALKDRLIVLFSEGRYRINPVLDDVVSDAFDAGLLFGQNRSMNIREPFADRNVIFAYLNLLISGAVPVREANTHHFVKSDRLEKVFPQFEKTRSTRMFTLIRELALREKAITVRESRFVLDRKRSSSLLGLDPLSLMAKAIRHCDAGAISRILGVLRTNAASENALTSLYSILTDTDKQTSKAVLEDMAAFGVITLKEGVYHLNKAVLEESQKQSSLSMDSDMEVSFYGIPDENDVLFTFADINVCDKLIRYSVTKASFTRALELGISRKEIETYLGINDNEQFRMWESAFSRINLYDGIVIKGDEQISRLIRMLPEMKKHVLAELSEGVFLMDRSSYQSWQEILAHAIDMPHLPLPVSSVREEDATVRRHEEPVIVPLDIPSSHPLADDVSWKETESELLDYAKKSGCMSDALKELIEARLIVSESQISKNSKYASMPSASGFDYNAKLSILRAALKSTEAEGAPLLRLELPDETIIAQPIEILKGENSSSMLKARVLPDGIDRSIPVSSIFKVTVLRWILS